MTLVLFALICLEPSVTFVLLPLTCLHPNFFSRQGHCIGTIRDWGPVHATTLTISPVQTRSKSKKLSTTDADAVKKITFSGKIPEVMKVKYINVYFQFFL